jgi:hypothetical protein
MSDVKDDKSDLTGQVEDSNGTIQELINEDEPNVSNDETIDENEKSQNQVFNFILSYKLKFSHICIPDFYYCYYPNWSPEV